jgi:hypothetical protein
MILKQNHIDKMNEKYKIATILEINDSLEFRRKLFQEIGREEEWT